MARLVPGVLAYRLPDLAEQRLTLDRDVTMIGRADICDVVIASPNISRLHARIEMRSEQYVLVDGGSTNGTFVNDTRLSGERVLHSGDTIRLGVSQVLLRFFDPEETIPDAVGADEGPTLLVNIDRREVMLHGAPIALAPREYELLLYLATHAGAACSREDSFLAAWHETYIHATCEAALNICVGKLRRKLDAAARSADKPAPTIRTLQRFGFRLDANVSFAEPGSGQAKG
jgi:DNA-binding winged helix-turn-helix (wHTH) protein